MGLPPMKRLVLLLTLIVVAGVVASCRSGQAAIAVETLQLDLGDVPNGQLVSRDVPVRNAGDAVLVVENISTSCGCTTAALQPMQLEPGQSGTLHIEFDSGAHGEALTGPLVRQVFIASNDPAQPEVTVELAVNVTPPLQVGSE